MIAYLLVMILFCLVCPSAISSELLPQSTDLLALRVPCFPDNRQQFYVHLLQASLDAIHQRSRIDCVNDVPARRMRLMLDDGTLNLFWGIHTPEKDREMIPIQVDLTNGLISQRILLIRPESQIQFDSVTSLDALRNTHLVAGFGEGWFDALVWKANNLPTYQHRNDWSTIYAMVAVGNRQVDYLPRGVNEIVEEARAHKELVIEKNLVLVYDADMRFYLTPRSVKYKPIIEAALAAADTSGLKARLIEEAFGADIKALNLRKRRRIELSNPPQ